MTHLGLDETDGTPVTGGGPGLRLPKKRAAYVFYRIYHGIHPFFLSACMYIHPSSHEIGLLSSVHGLAWNSNTFLSLAQLPPGPSSSAHPPLPSYSPWPVVSPAPAPYPVRALSLLLPADSLHTIYRRGCLSRTGHLKAGLKGIMHGRNAWAVSMIHRHEAETSRSRQLSCWPSQF